MQILANARPDLLKFWDYEKNTGIDPKKVSVHSHKLAWWTCEHGHSYQMAIGKKARAKNAVCSICSGNKLVPGVNDFATLAPQEILDEWCYEYNDVSPNQIGLCSSKKVWWKCKHGHYWFIGCDARIVKHSGCPYCSGREAIPGENDLYTLYPDLIDEWDYERNLKELHLLPGMIKPYSNRKVYWKCSEGHTWEMEPSRRTLMNSGCPYCHGHSVLAGYNDLATLYPEIAAEWNYDKNNLLPTEVRSQSNKTVWWKCSKHPEHEWQQAIPSRTRAYDKNVTGEYGCPYCNNRKLLPGFNDLQTLYPDLAEEWNEKKNGCSASEVLAVGTTRKYWWTCHVCKHNWQNTIRLRTIGIGCPHCNSQNNTSFIEQALFYYLQRDSLSPVHSRKPLTLDGKKYEVDVLIEPDIAIEYSGSFWHNRRSDREAADKRKEKALLKHGYRFFYLTDAEENKILPNNHIEHIKSDVKWLVETVESILEIMPKGEIDPYGKDQIKIMAQYETSARKKSIVEVAPEKATTWDYEKNYPLEPTCAFPTSKKIFWWKCPICGRSYPNSVANHINAKHDCPYCKRPPSVYDVPREESLAALYPATAACWVIDENSKRRPDNTSPKSKYSPLWKCPKCGHTWKDHVYRMFRRNRRCPKCGHLINPGDNNTDNDDNKDN